MGLGVTRRLGAVGRGRFGINRLKLRQAQGWNVQEKKRRNEVEGARLEIEDEGIGRGEVPPPSHVKILASTP